jgi:hypothetical protein
MKIKILAMNIAKYRDNFIFLLISVWLAILGSGCTAYYPSSQHPLELRVTQPYIDMRKEAESSSAIFYVIEKNQHFYVLGYSDGFFVIKTESGIEGWISEQQILFAVDDRGRTVEKIEYGLIKLNSAF